MEKEKKHDKNKSNKGDKPKNKSKKIIISYLSKNRTR